MALANREATIHWGDVATLTKNYPGVKMRLNQSLVLSGEAERIMMAGGGSQLAGPGAVLQPVPHEPKHLADLGRELTGMIRPAR